MTVRAMRFYSRAATVFVGHKRVAERLRQIDSLATLQAMREVRMADWEGRFTSKEQVVAQLHWYIPAYGGQGGGRASRLWRDETREELAAPCPAALLRSRGRVGVRIREAVCVTCELQIT